MNKLQYESSLYLRMHMNNPINWFAWGSEAFSKAKKENKPIFLSVGYSACHWCHVMERESFNCSEIADYLNKYFVSIKVDREERPDVDSFYMNFVHITTGSGGWPLNVFLTPELIPFFGGTYFPRKSIYNKLDFLEILRIISEYYINQKVDIESKRKDILTALTTSQLLHLEDEQINLNKIDLSFDLVFKNYDAQFGGFGRPPKFPAFPTLLFCLAYYFFSKDSRALEIVENTVKMMLTGGIYDQIGGGLHRYSTSNDWNIPHFEKMIYDNALFIIVLIETYRVSKNNYYISAAEDILNYLFREMTSEEGVFFTSQDADLEGEEGLFYIFSYGEIKEVLSEREFEIAEFYYGFTEKGNFNSLKNILTARKQINEVCSVFLIEIEEFRDIISKIRTKLFSYRLKRIAPLRDEKTIASFNGLMLKALSLAYETTGKREYLDRAQTLAKFLTSKLIRDGILYRCYNKGSVYIEGFLDDYAHIAEGLLELYQADGDNSHLTYIEFLINNALNKFYDEGSELFYNVQFRNSELPLPTVEIYDTAVYSGASSLCESLIKLSAINKNRKYSKIAQRFAEKFFVNISSNPLSYSYSLRVALMLKSELLEIFIASKSLEDANLITRRLFNEYFPFLTISYGIEDFKNSPFAEEKGIINGKTTIYACKNGVCKEPVHSYMELLKILE